MRRRRRVGGVVAVLTAVALAATALATAAVVRGGSAGSLAAGFEARAVGEPTIEACPGLGQWRKKSRGATKKGRSRSRRTSDDSRRASRSRSCSTARRASARRRVPGSWWNPPDPDIVARGELHAVVNAVNPPDPDLELRGLLTGTVNPPDPDLPTQRLLGNFAASLDEGATSPHLKGWVGDPTVADPTAPASTPAALVPAVKCLTPSMPRTDGGHTMSRNHTHMTRLLGAVLAACLLVPAAVAHGAGNPTARPEQGQAFIDEGRYEKAVQEFTCVIAAAADRGRGLPRPRRGGAPPRPLLGRHGRLRPGHGPRPARAPGRRCHDPRRLRGPARGRPERDPGADGRELRPLVDFDYAQAIQRAQPSSRRPPGRPVRQPLPRLEPPAEGRDEGARRGRPRPRDRARPHEPRCPLGRRRRLRVRPADPERAFAEASLALDGGLDTPRVHAILGAALQRVRRTGGRGACTSQRTSTW